ncbi:transcriptional repressor LexA [Candidatus Dojkabacteria bacterium]|uniref:Transcriptional repressor LexA n=1 Tax=Candidatus Dojkabacteria bacterium TaxID=2099670 RepID=A0A955KVY0_9BACT|nr:transcriptional repressor LexA [Candidatus Dojkabacteria bacterium]
MSSLYPLTKKQKEVLRLIEKSIDKHGFAPSLGEMLSDLGFSSKRSVTFHLEALERKGYITRTGQARGIYLNTPSNGQFFSVPAVGFANAGLPMVIAEEGDYGEITVDKKLLNRKRKVFGLELRGDSMDKRFLNGIPLSNGNYVIVSKDSEYKNGDVVLAVIDNAATIKSFKREKDRIVLYPESSNKRHHPIYIRSDGEAMITGKVLTALSNPRTEQITDTSKS